MKRKANTQKPKATKRRRTRADSPPPISLEGEYSVPFSLPQAPIVDPLGQESGFLPFGENGASDEQFLPPFDDIAPRPPGAPLFGGIETIEQWPPSSLLFYDIGSPGAPLFLDGQETPSWLLSPMANEVAAEDPPALSDNEATGFEPIADENKTIELCQQITPKAYRKYLNYFLLNELLIAFEKKTFEPTSDEDTKYLEFVEHIVQALINCTEFHPKRGSKRDNMKVTGKSPSLLGKERAVANIFVSILRYKDKRERPDWVKNFITDFTSRLQTCEAESAGGSFTNFCYNFPFTGWDLKRIWVEEVLLKYPPAQASFQEECDKLNPAELDKKVEDFRKTPTVSADNWYRYLKQHLISEKVISEQTITPKAYHKYLTSFLLKELLLAFEKKALEPTSYEDKKYLNFVMHIEQALINCREFDLKPISGSEGGNMTAAAKFILCKQTMVANIFVSILSYKDKRERPDWVRDFIAKFISRLQALKIEKEARSFNHFCKRFPLPMEDLNSISVQKVLLEYPPEWNSFKKECDKLNPAELEKRLKDFRKTPPVPADNWYRYLKTHLSSEQISSEQISLGQISLGQISSEQTIKPEAYRKYLTSFLLKELLIAFEKKPLECTESTSAEDEVYLKFVEHLNGALMHCKEFRPRRAHVRELAPKRDNMTATVKLQSTLDKQMTIANIFVSILRYKDKRERPDWVKNFVINFISRLQKFQTERAIGTFNNFCENFPFKMWYLNKIQVEKFLLKYPPERNAFQKECDKLNSAELDKRLEDFRKTLPVSKDNWYQYLKKHYSSKETHPENPAMIQSSGSLDTPVWGSAVELLRLPELENNEMSEFDPNFPHSSTAPVTPPVDGVEYLSWSSSSTAEPSFFPDSADWNTELGDSLVLESAVESLRLPDLENIEMVAFDNSDSYCGTVPATPPVDDVEYLPWLSPSTTEPSFFGDSADCNTESVDTRAWGSALEPLRLSGLENIEMAEFAESMAMDNEMGSPWLLSPMISDSDTMTPPCLPPENSQLAQLLSPGLLSAPGFSFFSHSWERSTTSVLPAAGNLGTPLGRK